jgi:CDP-6-deoxy-D-xylo-4-hexulose-3-dehydrase
MNKFVWPLNNASFTLLDRIKLCLFFLNKDNFWTQSKYVKKIEEEFAKFVGSKYAVFVSSGSTANTLLAMHLKDKCYSKTKNIVIFPSTTWTTSISPFIREGFKPQFIDINIQDFCLDLDATEKFLEKNHKKVAAILCVSLIGQVPDIEKLKYLEEKYKVKILLDNCENTLGLYKNKNISSYFTSTTSTYLGHQVQSVEGGFIFTNCEEEYEYFLMNRNHGMTRSLTVYNIDSSKYKNPEVNKLFDFYSLGNNFRNTDINAFIGLLDFSRIQSYCKKRNDIFKKIENIFKDQDLILPLILKHRTPVPFCFPFLSKDLNLIKRLMNFCKENHIETRPIISGNLLKQTCYKNYEDYRNFKNSEFLHTHGFYIGIYPKLSDKQINILKNFK